MTREKREAKTKGKAKKIKKKNSQEVGGRKEVNSPVWVISGAGIYGPDLGAFGLSDWSIPQPSQDLPLICFGSIEHFHDGSIDTF